MIFDHMTVLTRFFHFLLLGLALSLAQLATAQATQAIDPSAAPDVFLGAVANRMLDAVKADPEALKGETTAISSLVRQHALPYVDMDKTTRLAAGRHWREATAAQQAALVQAFTGTLIRTYSGAFTRITPDTRITLQPFRGDPNADDTVVRTSVSQPNSSPIGVDYRLEKTPAGWKVYDLNVEGIWLIQNYRNQFSQEISRSGINGLIQALNAKSGQ